MPSPFVFPVIFKLTATFYFYNLTLLVRGGLW